MKQIGLWDFGFVSDSEMITRIISALNQLPERQYIHKLNILRKPPDPNDPMRGGNLGFTSIKVYYSDDPYKSMFP